MIAALWIIMLAAPVAIGWGVARAADRDRARLRAAARRHAQEDDR